MSLTNKRHLKGDFKMTEDFFGNLGRRISETAQKTADKTSTFVEVQKLNVQSVTEQREIEKACQSIGELICQEVKEGFEVSPEVKVLVDAVAEHEATIEDIKVTVARLKGKKLCPSCGKPVELDDLFCSKCGAPVPTETPAEEEEPAEEDIAFETTEVQEEKADEAESGKEGEEEA